MAEGDRDAPLLTDDIRELLRLITQGDIAEVLIKRGNAKVHIKRSMAQPSVVNMVAPTAAPAILPAATFLPPAATTSATTAPVESEPEPQPANGVTVTAPMVGTFYGSPSPKEPPYVRVGDEVRPGDVLGIIEAMKIMNEIECEVHGRVTQVLVESAQPVEYGQPLMIIEPM